MSLYVDYTQFRCANCEWRPTTADNTQAYDDVQAHIASHYTAAQEPSPWHPIGSYDKAKHPADVLVATEHGVGEARQHDDGAYGRWFWANTCDDGVPGPGEISPTHWMPLPAAPLPATEPTK